MKRFTEQFQSKARTVKLTAFEKQELRERVVSYMEYHPLTDGSKITPYQTTLFHPTFMKSKLWRSVQWALPALFVVAVGLSSVAEQAVPGDALYAMKQINEDLRSTMIRGSYQKVVWETELLNRRIAEARILDSEGRLTEEAEVEVAKAVQKHTEKARQEIETLKETNEDDATLAAMEFTTAMSVQTTALQNDDLKAGEIAGTNVLTEAVLAASLVVIKTTVDSDLPAYDKLMAKVESETTRARELLFSITDTATTEERSDINRRLSDIDLKISTAQTQVSIDEIFSRNELVSALEQTHKLIVFMTNIDVRASMTVEEVVPVTLTEGERVEKVMTKITETNTLILTIEKVLSATSTTEVDEATMDKVEMAMARAKTAMSETDVALTSEPKNIVVAETTALEAYNLVLDSLKLLNIVPSGVGESPVVVPPITETPVFEISDVVDNPELEEGENVSTTTDVIFNENEEATSTTTTVFYPSE